MKKEYWLYVFLIIGFGLLHRGTAGMLFDFKMDFFPCQFDFSDPKDMRWTKLLYHIQYRFDLFIVLIWFYRALPLNTYNYFMKLLVRASSYYVLLDIFQIIYCNNQCDRDFIGYGFLAVLMGLLIFEHYKLSKRVTGRGPVELLYDWIYYAKGFMRIHFIEFPLDIIRRVTTFLNWLGDRFKKW